MKGGCIPLNILLVHKKGVKMKLPTIILLGFFIALFGCKEDTTISESHGRALMKIWESGKVKDLENIMDQDVVYEAVQQGISYKGIKEVSDYVGHVTSFTKDLKIEVISIKSTEKTAIIEWIMSGIQDRPIPGRITIATNKKFSIRGVTIVEIKNGLISKATDYMDVLGFVIQLGARVELPGGVVLENN